MNITSSNRDRWDSKFIFIFASVGSAVGLGNVWRFPYLVGRYGGGAFLIPYLIMLVIMGIPLLIMEFAIGQKMQLGAVGSFKQIKSRLIAIGLSAVLCGFVVVSYYSVVMAWCINYFVYSFSLKWGADTKSFFFNDVLHLSDNVSIMGHITAPILFALIIVWILVYFSVWKGVKSVGKVVMITMPVPIIILLILLVRGITLPGSMTGIIFYLKPDFTALLDFEVWSAAMSQIFFTLTLAFGVMIAYASYQHHSSDITKSALITSIVNSCISIISGFAVFATLGYMATSTGVDVSELAASGPSLAFIILPKALSMIPFAPFFAILFFIMLLTLGIDSAFSLVEAVSATINDKYTRLRKEDITLYVCVLGFVSSIIYSTFAGLYYLDITDHFITGYGLVIVGLLETIAVGWFYGASDLRAYINKVSDIKIGAWWDVMIKYVIPVLLLVLLVTTLIRDIKYPYEGYPRYLIFIFGWLVVFMVFLISIVSAMITVKKDSKFKIQDSEKE